MSVIELNVPDLGVDGEVEVVEILVSEGDTVSIDDPLCVLESDKATMEVPSEHTGSIASVAIKVGDKVSKGDLMASVSVEAGSASPEPVAQEKPPVEQTKAEDQSGVSSSPPVAAKDSGTASTSAQEVRIPDLGGAESVEIIELSVEAGAEVAFEDTILVLESDKATMEIPAPFAGKWSSVSVKVGDKVSEGDMVGVIETTSADGQDKSLTTPDGDLEDPSQSEPLPQPTNASAERGSEPPRPEAETSSSSSKVHAGPAVRKAARELGVDLSRVTGTGPNGRILKDDVKAYVKEALRAPSASPGQTMTVQPLPDFSQFGAIESRPMDKVQRITAENMQSNWNTIPHVTQFDKADITELEAFRKSKKEVAAAKGSKLTPLPFLLKACAYALKELPQFNVSLDMANHTVIQKQFVHIGVAVDTPHGLMVPVIRDVDKKSLWQLADEAQELAGKARDKKLMPNQMQGACFTISSLGGIGGTAFTPIVNAPEVAILGISKSEYQPVFDGNGFVPKLILPLSLSYDHRAVNGADAAKFTQCLARVLGDVRELLL